ncbi:MAG TPA: putative monovalent cation/H+ antiporter subunit A [Bryobacteraceae bacterium]|nr:putative monovalent cation/H+ antiporter subunit A [Bryobacteraceae bacterium]
MNLAAVVMSGFAAAALAPSFHRMAKGRAGWLLAVLPAGLGLYLASLAPAVWRGDVLRSAREWAPSLGLSFSFRLDGLSLLFSFLIVGTGAVVLVYAGGYLAGHARLGRFYASLLFFMASMLGLVLAENLVLLFIFWELTSISSYLLIGFDSEREKARKSALQALLVTGGGGLALLAGIALLGQAGGSFELPDLLGRAELVKGHPLYIAFTVLILVGAFTKSAQVPFHFWLPAAMEAPAPVSAYLHAATMVKAGVYLLARLSPVIGGTDLWSVTVTAAGAITMLTGAVMAIYKSDLKQLLAYSTVSVLGILTFLVGLGTGYATEAMAVFLVAHCLYKGALFLVAGTVDHETGTRDVERLGGLWRSMPFTATAGVLASLSMAGLPPMFGFIGKEMLYEAGLRAPLHAVLLTKVLVVTAILLFAVAGAVGFRPFYGGSPSTPKHPHEGPPSLWLGPLLLASGGLLLGLAPAQMENAVRYVVLSVAPGQPAKVELSLFHGLNTALLLSAASVLGGLAIHRARRRVIRLGGNLGLGRWGPARGYDAALASLGRLAAAQTRLLQSGYLRYYLLTVVGAAVALTGFALIRGGHVPRPPVFADVHWHEAALAAIILLSVLVAVRTASRLTAVAALGVVGTAIAVLFGLFGAPDLAMAQIAVETLIVVLLVLVLYHLPDFSRLTPRGGRRRDAVVAIAGGALMASLVLAAAAVPHSPGVAAYYLENSYPLAQGRNVVNVILIDFRALDTLGEITVVAVAGLGLFALLRLRPPGDKR